MAGSFLTSCGARKLGMGLAWCMLEALQSGCFESTVVLGCCSPKQQMSAAAVVGAERQALLEGGKLLGDG